MVERILPVEDEKRLARMVELEFQYEGYGVEKVFDGCTRLNRVLLGEFDLVLLDIMLSALSGMEMSRRLRRESTMPIIILTVRDTVVDRVSSLDMGADDYITKSFAVEGLLAHIWATLRKHFAQATKSSRNLLTAGPLTMDTGRHEVSVNGEGMELTRWEFDLLCYLLENKERIISRGSLLSHVWNFDFVGETNAMDVRIRFLRAKIDEHFGIKLIHTVRGMDYVIRGKGQ